MLDNEAKAIDNREESRWEIKLNDQLAFLDYSINDNEITLIRTKVPPEIEGMGIGSKLARAALDQARLDGLEVIPQCPFVAVFIRRHPAYGDLVARWSL